MKYLEGHGITEFVLCVAYLKKQIIDTFGDGSSLGLKVVYAEADVPLGTAGQLKTAASQIDGTFVVMNGDIVTNLSVSNLVATHKRKGGVATIALKEFGVKIPYGHVTVDGDGRIAEFKEKPVLSYMANAGVYAMEPKVLDAIPQGRSVSLETEVFPQLIAKGELVNSYFESAYWADVGSMADFERLNNEAADDKSIVFPERPPPT